jgi:hydroxyacylglutathione hydrolase
MTGVLPGEWIHGSPRCSVHEDPLQVHAFAPDTFIIRESKCADPGSPDRIGPSFEAPFMYLFFGSQRAMLLDTGSTRRSDLLPLGRMVGDLLSTRSKNHRAVELLVAHSHSHGDHVGGDSQFAQMPNVKTARLGVAGVCDFFGIRRWPDEIVTVDLGDRVLQVIPTPGHEESHITLYDRNTQLLLTGDTLYPGLLYVRDFHAYRASIERLAGFVEAGDLPVSHILGAHIEMKRAPGKFFGYPHPFFQPDEHVLELERRHLFELRDVVREMDPSQDVARRPDFIVFPEGAANIPPEDP